MRTSPQSSRLSCYILLTILFCLISAADATEKSTFVGWEKGSLYNGYYNFKERDSLKGKVLQFKEVTPLPGMDPGTAFILEEGDEKIIVHLCPVAYKSPSETGIRKGIKTKVSGCWAVIDGQDVFMAAKIKQGDNFILKVRLTKDGTPFWDLSPEELAKESAAD
ncbi:MAG: hypothetical protein KJ630_04685 [Proteobacteria bacterium]|nr:hypothetical protein [Pseudomonadota bacterium]